MDTPLPPNLPFKVFKARLSEKKQLNESGKFWFHHFELIEPNRIQFTAGQYIQLSVTGTAQKKSYSICSPPQTDHAVELMIDSTPLELGGLGTKYLMEIEPGQEATFMAPFGQFTVPDRGTPIGAAEKALVFVATGTGLAPIKSILEDLLVYKGDDRPMILHWGLRFIEDQCWFEDFELLSEQHPNFRFHPVLSKAPENWPLCRGRVTDCLTVHEMLPNAGYYVCGNASMIADVTKLLTEKGIAPEHIHHEKFH